MVKNNSNIAVPMSSTAITGFAPNTTTVYHGPDASVYASAGSIGNETVNILAQSMGWYHIEYTVNGTTQRKTGYVPKSALTNVSTTNISEEDFYGGYCYASTELDVRTCDVFANTAPVGTLYKNEGCTFLFSYMVGDKNIAFIEYSTSSGTKRGYVYSQYLIFPCETIVCIANETIPVYGGPDFESSAQLGTIYANELMSVVAKNNNVIYVEYNTSKGRKRGYVDWTKVNPRDYNSSIIFNNFYSTPSNSSCHIGDENVIVYGGPSTVYAQIGSVNYENITCFWTNNSTYSPLTCIEYTVNTTGKIKRGYIDSSKVIVGNLSFENNPLEDLTVQFPYFERVVYGKTQLNRDMVYYKTGSGSNHLFLTFALHGWEDGTKADGTYYHGDGNMLIKIAKRFMQDFGALPSSRIIDIQSKWTIFVFPGINLDGIVNGYNNNAFGRCLSSGLDPNRNWPGNFEVNTNSFRYKTGYKYLGNNQNGSDAIELINLKNVLEQNAVGLGENILIDVHGWYNQTVGNSSLAQSYWDSFGIPASRHSYSYGTGYLIAWAKNSINGITSMTDAPGISAKSCLLELPPTNDYSDTNMNSYGDKFFNGTLNILGTSSDPVEYPDNTNAVSFEKLFSQLRQLYDLASEYKPAASIKEKNILVLQYLRHLQYGTGAFEILYGNTDDDFISYIESTPGITKSYLNQNNIIVPDPNVSTGINIAHLAACLNGYLYDLPASIWDSEEEANNLGCWAGDLIQMGEKFEELKIDLSVQAAADIIAINDLNVLNNYGITSINSLSDCGFCYEDWRHDIDAVCLKDSLISTPIYQAFREYYTNPEIYNMRHHIFIEKIIPNGSADKIDIYSFVRPYLNPEKLTSFVWDALRGYHGRNMESLAVGFAEKLLYLYYLEEPDNPGIPNLMYAAHCQNLGWQEEKRNGEMAGLYGQGLRIEAIIMNADINIQYRVHMAGIGWGAWVPNGCMAGTTGESRAIEAIEIISSSNTMVGQGYVENIGYQSEVRGTHITIGTTGQALRLEGFRLKFE